MNVQLIPLLVKAYLVTGLNSGSRNRLNTFCTPSCRKLSANARIVFRLFTAFHFLVNSTDAYSVPLNIKWLSFWQQAVMPVGTRSHAAQTHAGRAKILSASQHPLKHTAIHSSVGPTEWCVLLQGKSTSLHKGALISLSFQYHCRARVKSGTRSQHFGTLHSENWLYSK